MGIDTTTTSPKPNQGPAPAAEDATTVGNYFVSNYPPFSCWKKENVPLFEKALEKPPKPDNPLGIYVHIPFCRKRCHFCYFKVYTDKNSTEIQGYVDAALKELEMYASKPFIGGRKPSFVYFGGGTPSYLSSKHLKYLTDGMKDILSWDEAKEIAFEAEPGTLTEPKLSRIKDMGVTRLSLGIENFDDHILEINGRAHRSKQVGNAYQFAQSLNFDQINIDLIAGMVDETEENWQDCIRKTIELAPDSVTIYQMEVPFNTGIYKQMQAEGKLTAPVADWTTKRRWVAEAFAALEKEGYTVGSAYTAVKDKEKVTFEYRDRLWEGADLLSVGVASFGHINGVHYQNEASFEQYIKPVNEGKFPVYRALEPTVEERLIREWVLQFKKGKVDPNYFNQKFDANVLEKFKDHIAYLKEKGFMFEEDGKLCLSRDGLLQVDRLLHGFFKPEHLNIRYT